jgi:hypothetical protein
MSDAHVTTSGLGGYDIPKPDGEDGGDRDRRDSSDHGRFR